MAIITDKNLFTEYTAATNFYLMLTSSPNIHVLH